MELKDLEFRLYNGEDECPNFATEDERRWWSQEKSVALTALGYPPQDRYLSLKDFAEVPKDKWPADIRDADASDGAKAVALEGYLNTKQWDPEGETVKNFKGYFDRPAGPFRVKD